MGYAKKAAIQVVSTLSPFGFSFLFFFFFVSKVNPELRLNFNA